MASKATDTIKKLTLCFLRHSNAKPATSPTSDWHRALTETGVARARALGELIRHEVFDLRLVSPALRAFETGQLALQHHGKKDMLRVPALYTPEGADGEAITRMSDALGNSPIAKYRLHPEFPALERLGHTAFNAIGAAIQDACPNGANEFRVFIIGHGVFIPMIVLTIVNVNLMNSGKNLADELSELSLGECDILRVVIEDSLAWIEHIRLPA